MRRPGRRATAASTSWSTTPGSPTWRRSTSSPARQWRETIETNLCGPFYFLRRAAPLLRRSQGWALTIASLAARHPFAGGAAYNASKFGVLGLTEAAMLDLRGAGVRVATILPGSVDTDFHAGRRPDRDWMLTAEDVARAVVDLLRYPSRALPSLVELRPARPPKK